jgi:RNA polymerase sigma factor (sigma-70 family)
VIELRSDGEPMNSPRSISLEHLCKLPVDERCAILLQHHCEQFEAALQALNNGGMPPCVDAPRLAWAVAYNLDELAKAIAKVSVDGRDNWVQQKKWTLDVRWNVVWSWLIQPLATSDSKGPSNLLSELALSVACEQREDWQPPAARPIDKEAANRAFAFVYNTYESIVIRASLSQVGQGCNPQEIAKDSWSSVFATYWSPRAVRRFAGFARISTLLFSVARHHATDEFRRQRKFVPLDESWGAVEAASSAKGFTTVSDPAVRLASDQLFRRAEECLERLPPKRRIYAKMVWMRQMSARDVARVSGISEAAVSEHLTKARPVVGDCLKIHGFHFSS